MPSKRRVVAFVLCLAGALHAQGGAPSGHHLGRASPGSSPPVWALGSGDVALGGTNEPTIVIDPNDSNRVAMASLFTSRVSTDGGATWTAELPGVVPVGYILSGDPTMGYDSQGRLFWSYLGFNCSAGNLEVFISEIDPVTGALLNGPFSVETPPTGVAHDKQWLAIDSDPASSFADRLYLSWTEFNLGGTEVLVSRSDDQGATWSTALVISAAAGAEGLVWPTHTAVAPNGDVYVSYHSQTGFNLIGEAGGNPDGVSGQVVLCRSTDGGVTFPQKTFPFGPGEADVTFNVQSSPGTIPGTDFWLQGSGQAWVLPDPDVAGSVYVIGNDDPDDVHGSGDDADVVIARSSDHGVTWDAPATVSSGPGDAYQVMPTAAIDRNSSCIVVTWYDNRLGGTNLAGNDLLNVFTTRSFDAGLTWTPDEFINDVPFDPDLGAPERYCGPPPTLRIGEYMGVAVQDGTAHAVWCGNTGVDQQTILDTFIACPWVDLGGGSIVTSVAPKLTASGPLTLGSVFNLSLTRAPADAFILLWLSLTSVPVDVLGGTLYANPFTNQFLRKADAGGNFSQSVVWPQGIPAGTELFLQFLVQDSSVPAQLTLSNAQMATTP